VANSVSYVRGDADDQNGHGTHVAGTIAAMDNAIGSRGVAPGAKVVAVRVLDRRGSGSTSGVIAGVDYVAGAAGSNDVANMSLGGGVSSSLDNAVIAASATCAFVLAAGNESDDADNHSPARANGNNIYTISAMDDNDNFAYFSNYGSGVDYCAPGVSIFSTWKGGGYNTISGTSMAAPHAAGVILLGNFRTDGTVNNDPDGNADSIIVH
jgi:subtilisin family serine protease